MAIDNVPGVRNSVMYFVNGNAVEGNAMTGSHGKVRKTGHYGNDSSDDMEEAFLLQQCEQV